MDAKVKAIPMECKDCRGFCYGDWSLTRNLLPNSYYSCDSKRKPVLRVAAILDSASAISYLHSSSSTPIYHRDIKSLNILLDKRHRAKVSDFGSSKTIAIDQTHLLLLSKEQWDILILNTSNLINKSDVYSFGVVLLELLTSKKPIYRDESSMEQRNLVTKFSSLMEQFALSTILDPEVVREAKEDELMAFVELATRCINWSEN
ncbi:LOW QUALITY PROTEIN: hypothetical protein V2J09_007760 [Rumex salicifolius]